MSLDSRNWARQCREAPEADGQALTADDRARLRELAAENAVLRTFGAVWWVDGALSSPARQR